MGQIVDMLTRTVRGEAPPAHEVARARVLKRLKGSVTGERLAQAQARAERLVLAGAPIDNAVNRAIVWALYATDPNNPPNSPTPIAA